MLHQATNSRFSVRLFCLHAWGALDYHADSGHSDQQKSFDDKCVEEDGLDESKLVSWSTYIYLCHVCRAVIITSDMNRIVDNVSDLRV